MNETNWIITSKTKRKTRNQTTRRTIKNNKQIKSVINANFWFYLFVIFDGSVGRCSVFSFPFRFVWFYPDCFVHIFIQTMWTCFLLTFSYSAEEERWLSFRFIRFVSSSIFVGLTKLHSCFSSLLFLWWVTNAFQKTCNNPRFKFPALAFWKEKKTRQLRHLKLNIEKKRYWC
jgi:hypothetical protein